MIVRKLAAILQTFFRPSLPPAQGDREIDLTTRTFVEPAHEALIRVWERVLEWQRHATESLPLQRAITLATNERLRQHGGLWHTDPRLAQAEQFLRADPYWLSRKEKTFIRTSTRLRRLLIGIVGAVATFSVVAAFVFYQQRQEAIKLRYRSIVQALASEAPRQQTRVGADEFAALLARQAFLFDQRYGAGISFASVYTSLREVLSTRTFSIVLPAHDRLVNSVVFSSDEKRLASGGQDGRVLLWDRSRLGRGPMALRRDNSSANTPITSVVFHPQSPGLAAGTEDGKILVWDALAPEPVPRIAACPTAVRQVVISPDGDHIAVGAEDRYVRVWPWQNLSAMPRQFDSRTPVRAVAFDPRRRQLIIGNRDGELLAWKLCCPSEQPRLLGKSRGAIYSLALSPDGAYLVTGDLYGDVNLWALPIDEAQPTASTPLAQNDIFVGGVAYSGNGARVAASNAIGKTKVWDTGNWDNPRDEFLIDNEGVASLALSPDGKLLATGNVNGSIRLRDLDAGSTLDPSPLGTRQRDVPIYPMAASNDGRFIAAARHEQSLALWKADSAQEVLLRDADDSFIPHAVVFRRDSPELLATSAKKGT
jgi:WD40 repeat protein